MKAQLALNWYELNELRWILLYDIKSCARNFAADRAGSPVWAAHWKGCIKTRGVLYRQILHAQTRLLERLHA